MEKNSGYIKARRDLLYGLCDIFNVKTTIAHDRSYVTMYGFETDLDFVQQMFDSLALQMHSMMEHDGRGQGRSWRTSYAHGFAYRVVTRLRLIRAQQEHDASDGNVSTALVLRDRSVAVQEDFNRRFAGAKLRSSYKNRSIRDGHGYASGDAAGSRADLGQRRMTGRRSLEG